MAEYWRSGWQWFRTREKREQQAILLLVTFLLGVILIYGVLIPSHNYYREQQQNYKTRQAAMNWLKANEQALRGSGAKPAESGHSVSGDKLVSWLTGKAAENKISLQRIEPGQNGVRLWIDDISEALLMTFIAEIERGSLSLKEVTISSDDKGTGRISTTLHITAPSY